MAKQNDNSLGMLLASSMQAMADRPVKTSETTYTTPLEVEDVRMRRDTIGAARNALAESLKKREGTGYTLGSALANLGGQTIPGQIDWLGGLRAFGGAYTAPTNAEIDRLTKDYEMAQQDLNTALAYDKVMGSLAQQISGYSDAAGAAKASGAGTLSGMPTNNFGRSVGYDPIENIPDFGPLTRAALSEEQISPLLKYIPGAQSVAKAASDDKTRSELQTLWGDVSDNILSGKVLDFVGKAGSIRVADTPAEQQFIFGPIRDYQSMSPSELRTGLRQARNNFVSAGMAKARAAGMDVSEQDFIKYWNSAFSVPESKVDASSYSTQDKATKSFLKRNSTQSAPVVGEIRNGIRFLGYENGKAKFEKVE